ncbi:MAG: hypothetical protein ACPG7B_15720 [Pseudomonadales bacterium]
MDLVFFLRKLVFLALLVISGAVWAVDTDGDYVDDLIDAFPNDPAASVDTDGDGYPDDWNEGKSAADSTSDPALVLDDDDDNDGVVDVNDDYPYDGQRSVLDGYRSSLCEGNYCVLSKVEPIAGQTQYFYKLREGEAEYDFHYGGGELAIDSVDGATSVVFEFFDGSEYRLFDASDGLDLSIEQSFLQALKLGEGQLKLRASAETRGAGWIFINLVSSLSAVPIVLTVANEGLVLKTVDELQQISRKLILNPPLAATGGDEQCFSTSLGNVFALSSPELDHYYLNPSRSISQGRHGIDNSIFTLSAGKSDVRVCSDTPVGSFGVVYEVMDGAGGRATFPLTIEISEEKAGEGYATWKPFQKDTGSCLNNFCVLDPRNSGNPHYLYTLVPSGGFFPFEHDNFLLSQQPGSGFPGYTFDLWVTGAFQEVNIESPLTESTYAALSDVMSGEPYSLVGLRRASADKWISLHGDASEGYATLVFNDDQGARVENLIQRYDRIVVNPPLEGTAPSLGWSEDRDKNCADFGFETLAQGFVDASFYVAMEADVAFSPWTAIVPTDRARHFYFCSNSPPGNYETSLIIIDGRGGKLRWPLEIEVLETKVAGGAIQGFRNKSGPSGSTSDFDLDDDGVLADNDAFPNDPAASVDTDGDGKPDDWNEGKAATDSTSDPALVLDDDDDNDGIKDHLDEFPLVASTDPLDRLIDPDGDYDGDGVINADDHFLKIPLSRWILILMA